MVRSIIIIFLLLFFSSNVLSLEHKGYLVFVENTSIKTTIHDKISFFRIKDESGIEEIKKKYGSIKLYPNLKLKLLLQDTKNIINATYAWKKVVGNQNITGYGSVCVIDSGIDYKHTAFGNCSIKRVSLNGTVYNYILESNHPYENNLTKIYKIEMENFTSIAVHFLNISTEAHYDFVEIYNSNMELIASYSGLKNNVWTPHVDGNIIYIAIKADESINNYGFFIDKIINGTTNTTINWSTCNTIAFGWDVVNADEIPEDLNGHGTHVSGIITANSSVKGISFTSKLVVIKIFNQESAELGDLLEAIDICINLSEKYNITSISMSLGSGWWSCDYCDSSWPFLSQLINKAYEKNISVVVATGNDYKRDGVSVPACIKNVIRVAATDKNDNIADFSNRCNIDILLAPGVYINSTWLSNTYTLQSGTSMAVPHVSATISLLQQINTLLYRTFASIEKVKEILLNFGKQIYDSDIDTNFSRIDVGNSIEAIIGEPIEIYTEPKKTFLNNTNITFILKSNRVIKNVSLIVDNKSYVMNITTFYAMNITKLYDGNHTFNFSMEDISGRRNESISWLIVDTKSPFFTILYPTNYSIINTNNVTFNIEINESYPKTLTIFENETSIFHTDIGNGSINITVSLSDGIHDLLFYILDMSGNFNSTNIHINVDTIPPLIITEFLPIFEVNKSINITLNVSDNFNITYIEVNITNSTTNLTIFNETKEGNYTINYWNDSIGEGIYNLTFFAIDTANNTKKIIKKIRISKRVNASLIIQDEKGNNTNFKMLIYYTNWDFFGEKENGTIFDILEGEWIIKFVGDFNLTVKNAIIHENSTIKAILSNKSYEIDVDLRNAIFMLAELNLNFSNVSIEKTYNTTNYTKVYVCHKWNITKEGCEETFEIINFISKDGKIVINTKNLSLFIVGIKQYCGDGFVDNNEECDKNNFNGKTCKTFGYDYGTLRCTQDCKIDKSLCKKRILHYVSFTSKQNINFSVNVLDKYLLNGTSLNITLIIENTGNIDINVSINILCNCSFNGKVIEINKGERKTVKIEVFNITDESGNIVLVIISGDIEKKKIITFERIKKKRKKFCMQVMTYGMKNGICKIFNNTCLPEGWIQVDKCNKTKDMENILKKNNKKRNAKQHYIAFIIILLFITIITLIFRDKEGKQASRRKALINKGKL